MKVFTSYHFVTEVGSLLKDDLSSLLLQHSTFGCGLEHEAQICAYLQCVVQGFPSLNLKQTRRKEWLLKELVVMDAPPPKIFINALLYNTWSTWRQDKEISACLTFRKVT